MRRATLIVCLALMTGCADAPKPKPGPASGSASVEPAAPDTAREPPPKAADPEPPAPIDWSAALAAAKALQPAGGRAVEDALEARAVAAAERLAKRRSIPPRRPADTAPVLAGLRAALGLDRLPKPAVRNVRSIGPVNRGKYVIERLTWQTLPGVDVPVHLYKPVGADNKLPAILFVPGHWWPDSKSRHEFQTFAAHMAGLGFVVLTFDPVGQGERGISFRDHRRTELLAVGVSQQGLAVHESLCALEYLLSLPYVDGNRIGITGASGGGYNSWITAAVEPRIAAAAPVVGTSEFAEQIRVCRPLDWYYAREHCHFIPGLLSFADNHELLSLIGPRPVMIVSARNDESFPIDGIRRIAAYGKLLYDSLGAPANFAHFEDATAGHGYQQIKREHVYGFFLRHLTNKGDGGPSGEPPVPLLPYASPELRCFPAGRNAPAGPGIIDFVRKRIQAADAQRNGPPTDEEFRKSIAAALGVAPDPPKPEGLERGPTQTLGRLRLQRITWRSVDGVPITALLALPAGTPRGTLIAAADAGKESLLSHVAVRAALDDGLAALLVDPRGMGELAVEHPGWVFATSLLLGESFVGRQAADLASTRQAAAALPELRDKPIALLGSGMFAGAAAAMAGALEPGFERLVVEGGFASFRHFVDRPRSITESFHLAEPGPAGAVRIVVTTEKSVRDSYLVESSGRGARTDREIPHSLFVFDVLRRFDLGDLLSASAGCRPTLVLSPIDGDFDPLSLADAEKALALRRFDWPKSAMVRTGAAADDETVKFVKATGR